MMKNGPISAADWTRKHRTNEKWEEFQGLINAITYKPGWYIRSGRGG